VADIRLASTFIAWEIGRTGPKFYDFRGFGLWRGITPSGILQEVDGLSAEVLELEEFPFGHGGQFFVRRVQILKHACQIFIHLA
jgi:hypothetical protein